MCALVVGNFLAFLGDDIRRRARHKAFIAQLGVDLGDLDEDGVKALIEKWLPVHQANAKPKADDKRLAAALAEVAELMGVGTEPEPAADY